MFAKAARTTPNAHVGPSLIAVPSKKNPPKRCRPSAYVGEAWLRQNATWTLVSEA